MHLILEEQIRVADNRIRREFPEDAHDDLAKSIADKGLMNPITLRKAGSDAVLVAGERRLRAIRHLHKQKIKFFCNSQLVPLNHVPFLWISELDDIKALEAELEENVCRRDLSWLEQVTARKQLFELRRVQAQAAGKDYTISDLAKELETSGASRSAARSVREEMAVAAFLDKPGVKEAKSLKEASTAAKKATQALLTEALGDMLGGGAVEPTHKLLVGDSLQLLKEEPADTYDCVCTDPPYGISIENSGSMVTNQHHYADGPEVLSNILQSVPKELFRICKPQAHVYWFCDFRWFSRISEALISAGFACYSRPIIWWKRGKAMVPDMTRWPKQEYECIVYAIKGDKPPLKVAGDVISTPYGADLLQAEKPMELYVELLSRSVVMGQKVIDPFCGSGVIFSAADELKVVATGIELHEARADMARIRAFGM